jgi:tetratricopeptide (TPR) repeat protein
MLLGACAPRLNAPRTPVRPPADSLETYIGKLRQLSVAARPEGQAAITLEASNPDLREALAAIGAPPTAVGHRRVADAYRRSGVSIDAHTHYLAALAIDDADAAAYEGLARIWRDWGMPALALGDAQRAVLHAPGSATAHNTLGTVLHALGRESDAERAFERATRLDPDAAYGWTNRCYLSFLRSAFDTAVEHCRRAVALDPESWPARNNLGLIHAATGDLSAAAEAFAAGGEPARHFNMGIVLSARREHAAAAAAFDAARALRPAWRLASDRAAQARRLAHASPGGQEIDEHR